MLIIPLFVSSLFLVGNKNKDFVKACHQRDYENGRVTIAIGCRSISGKTKFNN